VKHNEESDEELSKILPNDINLQVIFETETQNNTTFFRVFRILPAEPAPKPSRSLDLSLEQFSTPLPHRLQTSPSVQLELGILNQGVSLQLCTDIRKFNLQRQKDEQTRPNPPLPLPAPPPFLLHLPHTVASALYQPGYFVSLSPISAIWHEIMHQFYIEPTTIILLNLLVLFTK
jgi:hypothetical protein